jgi:hypothetical protein
VLGINRRKFMSSGTIAKMVLAATIITMTPAVASAQNAAGDDTTVTNSYDPATETQTQTTVKREEDRDFPWGLLGLLGLAGLLGRKKKESDIHVDARHNTRP